MSTNEAFIKAYRRDAARTAPPAPARSREPAAAQAVWQTSVQFVAADVPKSGNDVAGSLPGDTHPLASDGVARPHRDGIATAATERPAFTTAPPHTSAIGRRPLSAFLAIDDHRPAPPTAEPDFTPEMIIASFRWPGICRALWNEFGDQYQRVADLLAATSREGRTLIGITGLHGGDGCTTTLLCLAAALTAPDRRLILVDANFRAPRLGQLLDAQSVTTWHDVLEQGVPVAEAVVRAARDHVDLLPLELAAPGQSHPRRPPLAASLQTSITAGVLRHAYDVALVDLGALLAPRAFATAIEPLLQNMRFDAVVVVTDPRHAEHDDLAVAAELLDDSGCELLGVIENRITGD